MRTILPVLLAACCAAPALAQDAVPTYGGAKGADLTLEAIEPDAAPVTIALAGEYPADIARYLLANGALGAALSPDGRTIAFLRDITGQPELWTVPVTGGQPMQITFATGVDAVVWTPDSRGLLYEADRNGNEQPGYFVISADGAEVSSAVQRIEL